VDYLGGGISFAIFISLAYYGIRLMLRAKKNYPESAKKIGKELFIGIIGGSIVALAVLAGESPPILFPLVFGLVILLMGLAFAWGVE
jgi:hypothetical protein